MISIENDDVSIWKSKRVFVNTKSINYKNKPKQAKHYKATNYIVILDNLYNNRPYENCLNSPHIIPPEPIRDKSLYIRLGIIVSKPSSQSSGEYWIGDPGSSYETLVKKELICDIVTVTIFNNGNKEVYFSGNYND